MKRFRGIPVTKLSPILGDLGAGMLLFYCPGCRAYHTVETIDRNQWGAKWDWNQDAVKPTFTPSVNVVGRCHFFVRDGVIDYLSDCTHELAGKQVPMVPLDQEDEP